MLTAKLFRPLSHELVALLRTLPRGAWDAPTSAGDWRVGDVAAHLLDGDLRRISVARDGHHPPPPPGSIERHDDLVLWLDALNRGWVEAARRISPALLTELLELTGETLAELMEDADPSAEALFPVAWAGQTRSPMWLDMGREYTERWHHQDQIREAVGEEPLRSRRWLRPVLDVSLLALPHAYREVEAARGERIALEVRGSAGGSWTLERAERWRLLAGPASERACRVETGDLELARLLLHRLRPPEAAAALSVSGREELARPLLEARAVMVPHVDLDRPASTS